MNNKEIERRKELLKKLEAWCDSRDTMFTRFSCKENNGIIRIYRAENSIAQCINKLNFIELEQFLKKSEYREKLNAEAMEQLEKDMGL